MKQTIITEQYRQYYENQSTRSLYVDRQVKKEID